ncbi:MAG: ABC transporter permease [Anaerolineae bacterium]|nr:ABC transporter permease [Anaerolineae bacterium]
MPKAARWIVSVAEALLVRASQAVLSVVIALFLGGVVILVQGRDPLESYSALLTFSLGSPQSLATTLKNAVPLVLAGVSAAIAFASGPINLGQHGQLLIGALAATLGGLYLDLPAALMALALLALALAGGALWAGIAALLRHAFGMSEFIVTLMLNIVADQLTLWAIVYPFKDVSAFSPMTPPISASGRLPEVGGLSSTVFVAAAAVALVWFALVYTRLGYEWRIMGRNPLFARLGGCPVDRNFVQVMLLTGALAGLAGGLVVTGGPGRFLRGIGANYAWDGIMIAIVANNSISGTLFYGLVFAAVQTGALGMELITAVPSEMVLVLQGTLVLIIVASRRVFQQLADRLSSQRVLRRQSQHVQVAPLHEVQRT